MFRDFSEPAITLITVESVGSLSENIKRIGFVLKDYVQDFSLS